MSEVSMTKIYNVTIVKVNGASQTWTFLNYNDRDEFLDRLDELSDDYKFDIQEDEYWANSLDGAKQELNSFLGVDEDNEIDDTDKQVCDRWPNGD